jgi:hypothetical protein
MTSSPQLIRVLEDLVSFASSQNSQKLDGWFFETLRWLNGQRVCALLWESPVHKLSIDEWRTIFFLADNPLDGTPNSTLTFLAKVSRAIDNQSNELCIGNDNWK